MSTIDEPEPNLYERLGIRPNATAAEVTAAYRRRARSLHPDSAPGAPNSHALQEVIAAYRVLSDPPRRRDYDRRIGATSLGRVGFSHPRACLVCAGAGRLQTPCRRCAGAGALLTNTPWLQAPRPCPSCAGRGYQDARCGACAATGRR